jgi:hypothetical protein
MGLRAPAARAAMDKWTKLVWMRRGYQTRDAQAGYAPEPDWSKLPSFDELIRLAFGQNGVINNKDHPIARDLFGAPQRPGKQDDDLA